MTQTQTTKRPDPAGWMISQFSDVPGEAATLAALATLTEAGQRASFSSQYVHSRNGCAWAYGTGDGSQWSPVEVAGWCRANPANEAELDHLEAQDARRLRERLVALLGLEGDAGYGEIFAAVEEIQKKLQLEFA